MKASLVAVATLLALADVSGADPLSSLGQAALPGQLLRTDVPETDCDALRRSFSLRNQLRPSERRRLIARCEREVGTIRIAGNASPGPVEPGAGQ
jgi:hypothetical protein